MYEATGTRPGNISSPIGIVRRERYQYTRETLLTVQTRQHETRLPEYLSAQSAIPGQVTHPRDESLFKNNV
jgi:hypothetical protein